MCHSLARLAHKPKLRHIAWPLRDVRFVQFKGKISVIRNAGFYQSIVALRINTSNLEPETIIIVNGRNTQTVYT